MRSKFFIKTLSLMLVLVVSTSAFTSCNRSYDEKEVLTAAEELLRKAVMLNEVYYGNGISTNDTGHRNGYYLEADSVHLSRLGFETVEDLKNLTRDVFTTDYCEQIFNTKLESIVDESGVQTMARYYQYSDSEKMTPICIMVYTKPTVTFKDKLVYDYTTLRVSGVKGQRIYLTVTATVTNSEDESQRTDIDLILLEEDNGWRIDAPCYANYNAYKDRYDELNK